MASHEIKSRGDQGGEAFRAGGPAGAQPEVIRVVTTQSASGESRRASPVVATARIPRRYQEAPGVQQYAKDGPKEIDPQILALRDRIADSVVTSYKDEGIYQTQEGIIAELVEKVVEAGADGDAFVSRVTQNETVARTGGRQLWTVVDDLMRETEAITGEAVRYTPEQFTAGLTAYADAKAAECETADARKKEAGVSDDEWGLPAEDVHALREQVDTLLTDYLYIAYYAVAIARPQADFLQELQSEDPEIRKAVAKAVKIDTTLQAYIAGEGGQDATMGAMRSDGNCEEQSKNVQAALGQVSPTHAFIHGYGHTSTLTWHENVFVAPNAALGQSLIDLQVARGFPDETTTPERSYPVVSLQGINDPEIPPLGGLTVIDATALQMLDTVPFLTDIPYEERVAFARSLAPHSFSEGGVFVDTYTEYVRFLAKIGISEASFHPTDTVIPHGYEAADES